MTVGAVARRPTTQDLKVRLTRFPRVYGWMRLPYATARFLARRPHDPDYAAFGLFPQSDGLFLDVGANAGMSSMSLRIYQRRAGILAIEPNPYHERDLRWTQRVVGRMSYQICAAGELPGQSDLFIPVYRGVPITAEASLRREFVLESPSLRAQLGPRMDCSDFVIERRTVKVVPLDELRSVPSFVKVDVQGHEEQVLKGMSETLGAYGPPVLVEAPSATTEAFMETFGYRPYTYDQERARLVSAREGGTNVLFARQLPSGSR